MFIAPTEMQPVVRNGGVDEVCQLSTSGNYGELNFNTCPGIVDLTNLCTTYFPEAELISCAESINGAGSFDVTGNYVVGPYKRDVWGNPIPTEGPELSFIWGTSPGEICVREINGNHTCTAVQKIQNSLTGGHTGDDYSQYPDSYKLLAEEEQKAVIREVDAALLKSDSINSCHFYPDGLRSNSGILDCKIPKGYRLDKDTICKIVGSMGNSVVGDEVLKCVHDMRPMSLMGTNTVRVKIEEGQAVVESSNGSVKGTISDWIDLLKSQLKVMKKFLLR